MEPVHAHHRPVHAQPTRRSGGHAHGAVGLAKANPQKLQDHGHHFELVEQREAHRADQLDCVRTPPPPKKKTKRATKRRRRGPGADEATCWQRLASAVRRLLSHPGLPPPLTARDGAPGHPSPRESCAVRPGGASPTLHSTRARAGSAPRARPAHRPARTTGPCRASRPARCGRGATRQRCSREHAAARGGLAPSTRPRPAPGHAAPSPPPPSAPGRSHSQTGAPAPTADRPGARGTSPRTRLARGHASRRCRCRRPRTQESVSALSSRLDMHGPWVMQHGPNISRTVYVTRGWMGSRCASWTSSARCGLDDRSKSSAIDRNAYRLASTRWRMGAGCAIPGRMQTRRRHSHARAPKLGACIARPMRHGPATPSPAPMPPHEARPATTSPPRR